MAVQYEDVSDDDDSRSEIKLISRVLSTKGKHYRGLSNVVSRESFSSLLTERQEFLDQESERH